MNTWSNWNKWNNWMTYEWQMKRMNMCTHASAYACQSLYSYIFCALVLSLFPHLCMHIFMYVHLSSSLCVYRYMYIHVYVLLALPIYINVIACVSVSTSARISPHKWTCLYTSLSAGPSLFLSLCVYMCTSEAGTLFGILFGTWREMKLHMGGSSHTHEYLRTHLHKEGKQWIDIHNWTYMWILIPIKPTKVG